jgi:DNA-binding transcriptional MerR regulator
MRILAEPSEKWLTTGTVARMLERTREGVRYLVRTGQLSCEWTESGTRLFRKAAVTKLAARRTEARGLSRAAWLKDVRPRMLRVGLEPRQLSLFQRAKASERSIDQGQVKRPTLVRKSA